jgi:hypothetical protein
MKPSVKVFPMHNGSVDASILARRCVVRGATCGLGHGRFLLNVLPDIPRIPADIREIPDGFDAMIAVFDRLRRQYIAFLAGKRQLKPVFEGTETLTRAALPASRHTSPLVDRRI